MAVTLVSLSGFVWGIPSDETGINCSKFSVTVEPEINEWVPAINGEARGKVVGDPMGKLSIDGEYTGSGGVLAATFVAAFVPTNTTAFFGRSQGGFYLDSGTADRERGSLVKVSTQFSSRFNVA
jgi:hypothetical protein